MKDGTWQQQRKSPSPTVDQEGLVHVGMDCPTMGSQTATQAESQPDSSNGSSQQEGLQIENSGFRFQTAGSRFHELWSQLTLSEVSG
jgi:hypothetical protein